MFEILNKPISAIQFLKKSFKHCLFPRGFFMRGRMPAMTDQPSKSDNAPVVLAIVLAALFLPCLAWVVLVILGHLPVPFVP